MGHINGQRSALCRVDANFKKQLEEFTAYLNEIHSKNKSAFDKSEISIVQATRILTPQIKIIKKNVDPKDWIVLISLS